MARFSFLGSGTDSCHQEQGTRGRDNARWRPEQIELDQGKDVLDILKHELGSLNYVPDPDLPRFCGGAVGFIGYDMVRFFEDLPDSTADDLDLPDCTLIFTDTLLIFDHVRHRIRIVCNARIDGDPEAAYEKARRQDRGACPAAQRAGAVDIRSSARRSRWRSRRTSLRRNMRRRFSGARNT